MITNNFTEINIKRGIGSYFPILISLGITLYGFYLFLQTITDNRFAIFITIAFLAVVIIYVESHRASLLAEYLSAKLKKRVRASVSIPYIGFVMAFAVTGVFVALDTWGALQASDSIERMLIDGIVKNSEKYKIENQKAKSGVNASKEYQAQLREWRNAKNSHYDGCNNSWRVPKYRTRNQQCKDKFTETAPVKFTSTAGTIPIKIYEDMEKEAKAEIEGYKVFFFWGFLAFSILLNYFAVSSFFTQYRKKKNDLNDDVIAELENELLALEALEIKKLQQQTEVNKESKEKKDVIDVELLRATEHVSIAKRATSLDARRSLAFRVANRENYTDMDNSKSGFIVTSSKTKTVKDKDGHDRHDEHLQTEQKKLLLKSFEDSEISIIRILFKDYTLVRYDQLETRDKIVKQLHKKGYGKISDLNTKMSLLYSKLLQQNLIYKKIAYYSNVDIIE